MSSSRFDLQQVVIFLLIVHAFPLIETPPTQLRPRRVGFALCEFKTLKCVNSTTNHQTDKKGWITSISPSPARCVWTHLRGWACGLMTAVALGLRQTRGQVSSSHVSQHVTHSHGHVSQAGPPSFTRPYSLKKRPSCRTRALISSCSRTRKGNKEVKTEKMKPVAGSDDVQ